MSLSLVPHLHAAALTAALLFVATPMLRSQAQAPEKENEETITLTPFIISGPVTLGATPGGAKDIRFFRMGAGRGQIPHPNTFTAEGLFSEHDLPLELGDESKALFRVQTAATAARFDMLPEVRYLAQLGLGSGLAADSWKPAPLNLVAVVDKSGSMSGEPLELVRASLKSVLRQMRNGDQLSIVLYGDRSHVHLAPTRLSRASRSAIIRQIDAIASAGSTDMESGLRLGFETARQTKMGFEGNTRVMLFTDERPNVGNTEAESFMGMAAAASEDGIGLTTIGVGVQFGAELATRISSVRGGNLYFFASGEEMKKTFADDFDMMVTELAHEFSVRIEPADGFRIEGVFGVPADLLRWDGRALAMDVATIFLSRRKGAIFFAFAPERPNAELPSRAVRPGETLAGVKFSYRNASDGVRQSGETTCQLLSATSGQTGLGRGAYLVDQYLTLKKAAQVHLFENDQEAAFRLVSGLLSRLDRASDPDLTPERNLVRDLRNTFALLSGHTGEIKVTDGWGRESLLVGVWQRTKSPNDTDDNYLVVWPGGVLENLTVNRATRSISRRDMITLNGPPPAGRRGALSLAREERPRFAAIRFNLTGDVLRLEMVDGARRIVSLAFTRANYGDIPKRPDSDPERGEVDELSGLPRRPIPTATQSTDDTDETNAR